MKKTLILLLTLFLAVSLTFVSCDNKPADPGKSEATTTRTFDEETAEAVEKKNEKAVSVIDTCSNEIVDAVKKSTSLSLNTELAAGEGKTFSLVSAEDYSAYVEKVGLTGAAATPNKYENLTVSVGLENLYKLFGNSDEEFSMEELFSMLKLTISYKVSGKEKVTYNSLQEYFQAEDQMLVEMFALSGVDLSGSTPTLSSSVDVMKSLELMMSIATANPTVKLSVSVSDGKNSYALSLTDLLSLKDEKTLSFNDKIELKNGDNSLISLSYKASVTFSDDFKVKLATTGTENKTSTNADVSGSVKVSISDIVLKVSNVEVKGSISGTVDFTNEKGSAEVSLSEKVDGKDYLSVEFSIKDTDTDSNGLDALTIKSLKIEGVSYTPESVLAYLKSFEKNEETK